MLPSLLSDLIDPQGYPFWLFVLSGLALALERLWPARREQKLLRRGFSQDLLWLLFNGHVFGLLIALALQRGLHEGRLGLEGVFEAKLLQGLSLPSQFLIAFLVKDLFEWGIHNLLHRVPWLWRFHQIHHSIEELDWIGNFRFHWVEILVYRTLTWLPLSLMGADASVLFAIALVNTAIGHLNHANLAWSYGPLRYVFNSPRMHIWHHMHDLPAAHPKGLNFGISLSLWDWLFGTAYWPSPAEAPSQRPERLGFPGLEQLPQSWLARLIYPLRIGSPRRRPAEAPPTDGSQKCAQDSQPQS